MIVNHNNIERWIFDYFEGDLSLHEQMELKEFIKRNPEYSNDFREWEEARVSDDEIVSLYPNANALLVAERSVFTSILRYASMIAIIIATSFSVYYITDSIDFSETNKQANLNVKQHIKGNTSVDLNILQKTRNQYADIDQKRTILSENREVSVQINEEESVRNVALSSIEYNKFDKRNDEAAHGDKMVTSSLEIIKINK